jgi:hypothetical protein
VGKILERLSGGDLRSIGRANKIVGEAIQDPKLIPELFAGVRTADPVIKARCADVLEKLAARRPELIQPFCRMVLNDWIKTPQQEVRWHAALILSHLALPALQRRRAATIMWEWMGSEKSNIVRVSSLEALVRFAQDDASLRRRVLNSLRLHGKNGAPSIRARSRILLKRLTNSRLPKHC